MSGPPGCIVGPQHEIGHMRSKRNGLPERDNVKPTGKMSALAAHDKGSEKGKAEMKRIRTWNSKENID